MPRKTSHEKTKCPGCHAYFTEGGELCDNCKATQHHEEDSEQAE